MKKKNWAYSYDCRASTGPQHRKVVNTSEKLTLTDTNRGIAARLALAVGSLHGATVVKGMRIADGNVTVSVCKALVGLTGETLELFSCTDTCQKQTVMTDWLRGTVVKRRSVTGELSLFYSRPVAEVSQLGQLSLSRSINK